MSLNITESKIYFRNFFLKKKAKVFLVLYIANKAHFNNKKTGCFFMVNAQGYVVMFACI